VSSDMKYIRQIKIAFSIVALLLIVMAANAIREVNKLAELTEKMYIHPFTVSNSVLTANQGIIAMHRYMKDVVLAENEQELNEAISNVDREEMEVYREFDIVMLRFLGDKSSISAAYQAFFDWKAIRQEVIMLTRNKKTRLAAQITKGKGAEHVLLLTSKMDNLIEFARNKAQTFHSESKAAYSKSIFNIATVLILLLGLIAFLAFFVVRAVTRGQNRLQKNEKKFRNLFSSMANGVIYQNSEGNILLANEAALEILGHKQNYQEYEREWRDSWEVCDTTKDTRKNKHPVDRAFQSNQKIRNVILQSIDKKQENRRWLLVNSTPLVKESSNVPYQVCSTFTDITDLKKAENELTKLSRAVTHSSSSILITNAEGIIEYVNPTFTKITGYRPEEAIGQTPRLLKSGETPENIYVDLWKTIRSGRDWKGEFHNRKKNGEYYWAHDSISAVRDDRGKISHFVGVQEDVTSRYEMSEKLSYQASHDILTGLINRYEF